MKRREFFTNAGAGSLVFATACLTQGDSLTSSRTRAHALTRRALEGDNEGRTNFHFDCQVKGPLAGNVQHFLAMAGCGGFNDAQVEGSGGFFHIDFNSPVPKTIFASGSWKARRLVSFQPFGAPYGVFQAGIAHLDIDLVRVVPSQLVVPATLRIVCSIAAAGPASITGLPEGIVLAADGLTFDQPVAGLTVFTIGVEEREG